MQGEGVPLDAFAARRRRRARRALAAQPALPDADRRLRRRGRPGRAARRGCAPPPTRSPRRWAAAPPAHPVIVAGSTGSRAADPRLHGRGGAAAAGGAGAARARRRAAAGGLGPARRAASRAPPTIRSTASAGSPRRSASTPARCRPGTRPRRPRPARNALVSLALRPAPVTDQWRAEGGALAPSLAAAADGPDLDRGARPEARGAGDRARAARGGRDRHPRRARHPRPDARPPRHRRARPLGPDPRRQRRPAAGADPARRAAAPASPRCPARPLTPEALLALLKHPLVASAPGARGPHLRLRRALRDRRSCAAGRRGCAGTSSPPSPRRDGDGAPAWLAWLRAALEPLAAAGRAPLAEHVARHRAAAEALAAGPARRRARALGQGRRRRGAGARRGARRRGRRRRHRRRRTSTARCFQSLIAARDVPEEAVVAHPGLAIWGTLEARVQAADRVILGGLNEGVWPRLPGADPWLDRGAAPRSSACRARRRRSASPRTTSSRRRGAREVVLARATRDAEAPTVASRWLLRLENLLAGLPPEGRPRSPPPAPAARAGSPSPTGSPRPTRARAAGPPPGAAPAGGGAAGAALGLRRRPAGPRPLRRLRRARCCGLRRLDPPGRKADALTRGNAIHAALDAFVAAHPRRPRPRRRGDVPRRGPRGLRPRAAPWPAVNALWTARLMRAARWFLDGEAGRRAAGTPAAREVSGQPRCSTAPPSRSPPAPTASTAPPAATRSTTTSPARPRAAPTPLRATCSCRSRRRSRRPAASTALAAGPVARLELIRFGGSEPEVIPLDAEPAAIAATWARLGGADRPLPRPGDRLRRPPAAAASYPGDYDHLSRLGEWADGDEPDPEPWA